ARLAGLRFTQLMDWQNVGVPQAPLFPRPGAKTLPLRRVAAREGLDGNQAATNRPSCHDHAAVCRFRDLLEELIFIGTTVRVDDADHPCGRWRGVGVEEE